MTYLDRPSPARSGAWAHSTLGAVVHNALRAFFALSPEQRTPEQAAVLLRKYWKSDGFSGPDQAAEYRARAEGWLTDYVEQHDVAETPLAVERWVSAPVGTIIAEGRVDRIDQRREELVVVDYKTGRYGLKTDDARDSMALALYALASRKTFRARCDRVELHHLPSGEVVSWEHTSDSLEQHLRRAEELAEQIRSATDEWEAGEHHEGTLRPAYRQTLLRVRFPRALPGRSGGRGGHLALGAVGEMNRMRMTEPPAHGPMWSEGERGPETIPEMPVPPAQAGSPRGRTRPTRTGTWARGLTGSLAMGLLALALALIGMQFWSTHVGRQGPGMDAVITHVVTACVVLTMQAVADRRRDLVGGLLTAGVFAGTIGHLWFWWW